MKRILGLNRATSNTLVRGDMGRYSLQSKAISRNIKYLNQIKHTKGNSLVKQAYLYEGNQSQNRISIESSAKKVNTNLKNLLNKEIDVYKLSNYELKQYIDTIFCESWKNKLSNSSKASIHTYKHTYKTFKNIPKFEKYLDDIKNMKYLKALTKLRLSDHKLMIEEGRRKRPIIPREERICKTWIKLKTKFIFL